MDLIITEQSRSIRAYRASKGTDPMDTGQVSEISLPDLLTWLKTKDNLELDATGDITVSQFNQVGLETHRTTISCDENDRAEVIEALSALSTIFPVQP